MGLLGNGKTCEVLQGGYVRGYVFTEASSTTGVDQLQRWFLFSTFAPVRNGNDMRLRNASSSPWSGITTAAAFVAQVEATFRDGDRYVKVNCSTPYTPATPGWSQIPVTMPYPPFPALGLVEAPPGELAALEVIANALTGKATGGTRVQIEHGKWTTAAGELEIERAVFRPADPGFLQADPGTGKIWQGGLCRGWLYTTLQSGSLNVPLTTYERFLFLSGYAAVPGSGTIEAVVQGVPGFGSGTLGDWVGAMNAGYWTTGSSMVVSSCSWGYRIQDVGILERAPKRRAPAKTAKRRGR